MRSLLASAPLAAAFFLTLAANDYAPALAQDFSITNPEEPGDANHRDVMRQLQAWWDAHAYYPRHASNNDEAGTVKLHLEILPDGRIWSVNVVGSSGSSSLDGAGSATFSKGFVRRLPEGAPEDDFDISLHYVLAHRHDEPVAAGYKPVVSKSAFTITNDPVTSPILDKMLQRTCTGEVVKQGIRNHPIYGVHYWAQAVFFRKADGSPWVKFYEGGFPTISPVTEVGKMVQWTGRQESFKNPQFTQYTLWADSDSNLSGNIEILFPQGTGSGYNNINHGGTVTFTCATEVVPAVSWSAWSVTPGPLPPGDPP
jgi:TonB family protein